MNFLIPLGFLGLLGLGVLILIYIIKPNYQQKLVSSTFVWKLSLKYQKKRIPISKLRNLLILICQILILILCAFILAQPAVIKDSVNNGNEKVVVIDASASMWATCDDETRFERAVNEVIALADDVLDDNGMMSVILAGTEATFVEERVGSENKTQLIDKLNDLLSGETQCTYGSADVDGAMVLAETITAVNPSADVLFYTGKKYLNPGDVTVVDMSRGSEEWNVAVLDSRAVFEEGYYTFAVDIACFGRNVEVQLNCYIDLGEHERPIELYENVILTDDIVRTVEFKTGTMSDVTQRVFEYSSVRAYVQVDDSFADDNSFVLYGGIKPKLRVQYFSSAPNTFFSMALMTTANALKSRWDMEIDEVRGTGVSPALEGYDFYIFENRAPQTMPKDGVVFLVNPQALPNELGVVLGDVMKGDSFVLAPGEPHALTNYMNLSNLLITQYTSISKYNEAFTPIMYCAGVPVFLSRNDDGGKVAVMTFGLNFSDIAINWDFPTLIYNMFEYYLPSTFTKFIYNVNETVTLRSRGFGLTIEGNGVSESFVSFPAQLTLSKIGTYTTKQTLYGGKDISESFYVKIADEESNIVRVIDVLDSEIVKSELGVDYNDLLVYFAAILVTLLFAEWFLQSRTRI